MRNTNVKYPNNTLKEYRLRSGLTQEQVSQKLNMQCEGRLSRWEKGLSVPSLSNLGKLSQMYRVSPDLLYPEMFLHQEPGVLPEAV